MIKLICCDLDGTLLNDKKQITSENILAIKNFIKHGGHVSLTTGRPINGIYDSINKLNLLNDTDASLACNGAIIMLNKSKKILYSKTISGKTIKSIYFEIKKYNLGMHFFNEKCELLTTKMNKYTKIEETNNNLHASIISIDDINDEDKFIKAVVVGENDDLDIVKKSLMKKFDSLSIVKSSSIFLEFLNKEVSKKNGLLFLKKYYNLKDNEIMAIGDQENDLSMIKTAYIGVAMKNAIDELKKEASFITNDNNSNGVAIAIKKYGSI